MPERTETTVRITAAVKGPLGVAIESDDEVGYASWLSREILLVVLRSPGKRTAVEGALVTKKGSDSLDLRYMPCAGEGLSFPRGAGSIVSTIHIPSGGGAVGGVELVVTDADGRRRSGPFELAVTDLKTTLRRSLTALDASERGELVQFIASAFGAHQLTDVDFALSKSLFTIRQALRERLPTIVISQGEPLGMHIDAAVAADPTSFYMQGWIRDSEAPISRITAVSPEGEKVELLDSLFFYSRSDVSHLYGDSGHPENGHKSGIIGYFELETPSCRRDGWVFEIVNEAGTRAETSAPPVIDDPISARMQLLSGLPLDALPDESLMSQHVHPAISRISERHRRLLKVTDVIEYGHPSAAPEVSVIIPLYGRVDFMEHQLAQFVLDPEMQAADLIYVLDSPSLERMLRDYSAQLHRLYRVPFRVVMLERSCGFAAANNAGVDEARGSLLLLLNSDVLPDHPGWLSRMADFYRNQDNIGALGPKLLYPDESLQHAGMFFDLPTDTALAGLWRNVHYFKGMQRDLPAANVARPVPAVTGACLMMARELYHHVGGFPDVYVQGDHEDSDLCLRLIEEGRENWYLPDVELYHLEGQSYPSAVRGAMALYNRWLHTRRLGEQIEAVMRKYPSSIEATVDLVVSSSADFILNPAQSG
jgi:GT2 family glycosyltransferase